VVEVDKKGMLTSLRGRVVEVDKKRMPTTSLRGRVVEVDKKGMPTTSLRGRVVEVDQKGMPTTSLRGRVVEVDKKGMLTSLRGRVVEVDKKGMLTSLRGRKLQRKYKTKQAIYLATKKDLLRLCKSRVIPVEYHDFYKGLPANAKVNDTLPSPDAEEDEQDSDKE
jgi:diphthamide synthase (EF-2-diphthine--ammonia ligase)